VSLLKKFFTKDTGRMLQQARDLMDSGRPGEAKMLLEKILPALKDEKEESKALEVRENIARCRDQLASQHLESAALFIKEDEVQSARSAIEDALEVVHDESLREKARSMMASLDAAELGSMTDEATELDDDELFNIIAGTWNDRQADEFEELGPEAVRAAILMHEGKLDEAKKSLISLASANPDRACYILMEKGKLHLMSGEKEEAVESFELFLDRLPEDADDEVWINGLTLLGQSRLQSGDNEGAEEALREAAGVDMENYLGFLNLGVFLRGVDQPGEAVVYLEKAESLMSSMSPDMRVIRELGMVKLDLGDRDAAKNYLAKTLELQAATGQHGQFDPAAAVELARIHEEDGDIRSASDIFRHLCEGYDRPNYFIYHLNAGRLLKKLGETDLAGKYLAKAAALAPDEDGRIKVDSVLKDE